MKSIKIHQKMKKIIGGIVLVDSLIVGMFIYGNHTPIKLDNTNQYLIKEVHTINGKESIKSFYEEQQYTADNYIIYYKKPFISNGKIIREVVKVYENNKSETRKEIQYIPCDSLYLEEYTESVVYVRDLNDYITVKQSVKDEIKDDAILLGILAFISSTIYTIGKSVITRETSEDEKIK